MNRLGKETSPYLLQHADNPVEWYPWGEEAFNAARKQNKPILLSVGYATCHWCHVMEKESFCLEDVASVMNDHFINIKVDREEMPDVDKYYMNAVQMLTGSSGWPLNAFLLPDKRPFYGGTYFPPIPSHGRPSWTQLLLYLSDKFENNRSELEEQAEQVSIKVSNIHTRFIGKQTDQSEDLATAEKIFEKASLMFDEEWGGFGGVPKFPPYLVLKWLLQYGYQMDNPKSTHLAIFTLKKMIRGGIYDQLGGGISRYATDKEWLIPHFEKMLYDNAQLLDILSQAYSITQDKEILNTIHQTAQFLRDEMQDKDGGFFSAWDADSEGEEGKYYVWSNDEIKHICGDHAEIIKSYFSITEAGNFEGKNILTRHQSKSEIAEDNNISKNEVSDILKTNRLKLLSERKKRVKPGLDYKKILSWNALCVYSMLEAARVTDDREILKSAIKGYKFIKDQFGTSPKSIKRICTNGQVKYNANFDDYAMYARAALSIFYTSQNTDELKLAVSLCNHVVETYYDEERKLFSFLPLASNVLHNSFEIMDYTIPSGNSIIVNVLHQIGTIYNNTSFLKIADDLLNTIKPALDKYPLSMGQAGINTLNNHFGYSEIIITGENPDQKKLHNIYIPGRIVLYSKKVNEQLPILEGKIELEEEAIFLCRNFQCYPPIKNFDELKTLLKS